MKVVPGQIAVVTGGGSGMGRELCLLLTHRGCDVALCDVSQESLDETLQLCAAKAISASQRFFGSICDVGDEQSCLKFAGDVSEALKCTHINMLFNNAGFGGGGTIFKHREVFDSVVQVCWFGVYYMTLAFLHLLKASDEGALINTSSFCGFYASAGVAYSTAKFAVRGFSEGLIMDFKEHAPHLSVHLVLPGYVSTNIAVLSTIQNYRQRKGEEPPAERVEQWKAKLENFTDNTSGIGLSAADAAMIIVDGVEDSKFAILVGDDAVALDKGVRAFEIGSFYPLENEEMRNPVNVSMRVARLGDPSYYLGRQSQLASRSKAKQARL